MNRKTLIADIQGFKNDANNFIVKEFALATPEYTQVFLVKPPYAYRRLTDSEKKHVKWVEKNLGYRWSEGHIDYLHFKRIIKSYLEHKQVLVKGLEKTNWIKELCDSCVVIDIETKGCPSLLELIKKYSININPSIFCCINHKINCALKNVICIKQWCLDFSAKPN